MPQDPECSTCRNILDIQRMAAVKALDRKIAADHAAGYGTDVDALLDKRAEIMDLIRTGPHA